MPLGNLRDFAEANGIGSDVLERAGLLSRRRRGRECHCRLEAEALRSAEAWLQSCADRWQARLDRLDELLRMEKHDG